MIVLLSLIAAAAAVPAGPEAVVPGFAADGYVQKKIDGDRGVYVQAQSGRWFYLRPSGRCSRLAGSDTVGIETAPGGQLDRSAVLTVEGERCLLSSVVEVPPPAPGGRS